MAIKSKGYQVWDGQLLRRALGWTPIFRQGVLQVFRKKRAKALYIFAGLPLLIFAAVIYVMTKPELKVFSEFIREYGTDPKLFGAYFTNGFMIFILLLLSVHAGASQIAGDRKSNAFALYFARPITKLDYILGKLAVVMFYLLAFTLAPGLILILLKMLFTGSMVIDLQVAGATVIFPLLVSLCFATMILAFSSLARSGKLVTVVLFVLYFASDIVQGILSGIFRSRWFHLLSLRENIQNFGWTIFGANTRADDVLLGWLSGLVLLVLTAVFGGVLALRIRRVEA
ncbi:MAG: ABC transporter permease [Acidobacteria bacterium]|nr:ABC transporter permease [Acidobacteriota bacterium]